MTSGGRPPGWRPRRRTQIGTAGAGRIRHLTVAVGRAAAAMRRYVGDIAAAGTSIRDGSWADAIARARAATTLVSGVSRREADPAQVFARPGRLPPAWTVTQRR